MNLTPLLLFDGNCAEAMMFYHHQLGGKLTLTAVSETPMRERMLATQHHKIVHAHLKSGGIEFSATDWLHSTRRPKQGNTVAMYVNGGTNDELPRIFDKLSVLADRDLPDDLREMPFGSYGHLADQFGVHWFFRGETAT
ncbi:MAG: VOC family protein [Candidatus Dormibacteria bacterium]